MVRRLKEDVRQVQGGFPKRNVVRIKIDGLPEDAPEIALSRLLDEYRTAREVRHADAPKGARAAAGLLVVGLQQRLLSSVEAFARSLKVHRATVRRHWEKEQAARGEAQADAASQPDAEPTSAALAPGRASASRLDLFGVPPDADDERADWDDADADAEEAAQIEAITLAAEAGAAASTKPTPGKREAAQWANEQRLLDEMERIAEEARYQPDAKTLRLIDWIRENQCPDLSPFGEASPSDALRLALDETSGTRASPKWNNRRVLIFTENRQGTKRYLHEVLEEAVRGTDRGEKRIEVIDGRASGARRREVQRRFNARPKDDPLRILIATDAAREGLNFQAHCTDLFHFDLPWNPGRIEQRNGRIDRKLQPASEVNCHYFVLPQRFEDRVLEVLVKKTETIQRELGSLSKVIDADVERRLSKAGIRRRDADPSWTATLDSLRAPMKMGQKLSRACLASPTRRSGVACPRQSPGTSPT